jgi:beta-glucosidase
MTKPRVFRALGFERLEDRRHLSTGLIHISAAVGIKGLEGGGDRIRLQGDVVPPPTVAVPRPESWAIAIHNENVVRAQQDQAPVIFLGDSITANWGDAGRAAIGSTIWDSQILPYRAENFGITGNVTQSVLWQINDGELAGHPKAVVLLIGTNNLGGLSESPEDTAAGIAAVVQQIRTISPSSKVLIMGLFPRGALPSDPLRAAVSQTNILIANLGDGQNVRFLNIDFAFEQFDGTILRSVMYDFIHLNVDGYQIWANDLAVPLQQMLGLSGPPPGSGSGTKTLGIASRTAAFSAGNDLSMIVPLAPDPTMTQGALGSAAFPASAGTLSSVGHKRLDLVGAESSSL